MSSGDNILWYIVDLPSMVWLSSWWARFWIYRACLSAWWGSCCPIGFMISRIPVICWLCREILSLFLQYFPVLVPVSIYNSCLLLILFACLRCKSFMSLPLWRSYWNVFLPMPPKVGMSIISCIFYLSPVVLLLMLPVCTDGRIWHHQWYLWVLLPTRILSLHLLMMIHCIYLFGPLLSCHWLDSTRWCRLIIFVLESNFVVYAYCSSVRWIGALHDGAYIWLNLCLRISSSRFQVVRCSMRITSSTELYCWNNCSRPYQL